MAFASSWLSSVTAFIKVNEGSGYSREPRSNWGVAGYSRGNDFDFDVVVSEAAPERCQDRLGFGDIVLALCHPIRETEIPSEIESCSRLDGAHVGHAKWTESS